MKKFMNYTHLSHDQRGDSQYYHNVKEMSVREIAAIGASNSTVSRELKRNTFKKINSSDDTYSFVYEANTATKNILIDVVRIKLKLLLI